MDNKTNEMDNKTNEMDNTYIICGETGYYSDRETEIIAVTNDLILAENKVKEFKQLQDDYIQKVNNFMNDKIAKDKTRLSKEKFYKKYRYLRDNEYYNHDFEKTRFSIIKKKNNVFDFDIREDFSFDERDYESSSNSSLESNLKLDFSVTETLDW